MMKTSPKRWVWPLVAGWVGLMALMAPGSGLSLVVLVPLPTLVLGFALGRVHAWRALAVSGAAGLVTLLITCRAMSDTNVDMYAVDEAFDLAGVLLSLVTIPLVMGGTCGVFCRALRQR